LSHSGLTPKKNAHRAAPRAVFSCLWPGRRKAIADIADCLLAAKLARST
jgi:hypothetical protein